MESFRLTLEYDGRDFAGWQVQAAGQRTVQGEVEAALQRISGLSIRVHGAGRTDAGVHAEGQVASFEAQLALPCERLGPALNALLPRDLAVRECRSAPPGFHARFDARGKLYRYQIWNSSVRSPLREGRWHRVGAPLDLGAMRAAAGQLVGQHDFASFAAQGGLAPGDSSVRTLRQLRVEEGAARGEIQVLAEAPGFLRHMVRNLAGTLIEVGRGRFRPEEMAARSS